MRGFPAYCTHCGTVFIARNLIGGSYPVNVNMSGARTPCPSCGNLANLADGKFVYGANAVELLSGPAITVEIVERFRDIAQRAHQGEITRTQAIKEAGALEPNLAILIGNYAFGGLALLLAIIQLWLQVQGDRSAQETGEAMLAIMEQQAATIERMADDIANQVPDGDAEPTDGPPTKPESKPRPMPEKPKSKRRATVNKARRQAGKLRRQQFPRTKNKR